MEEVIEEPTGSADPATHDADTACGPLPSAEVRRLRSYTGLYATEIPTFAPASEEELAAIVCAANAHGARVVIRGGETSLHTHAMLGSNPTHLSRARDVSVPVVPPPDGDAEPEVAAPTGPHWAVQLGRMLPRAVLVDPSTLTMRVHGHCTFGDVLAACLPLEVLPHVVPSSARISVAGALAGDGLSRHSPLLRAKMSHLVRWLRLMVGDGTVVAVYHPRFTAPPFDLPGTALPPADNEALFRSVVCGFGLSGVVLELSVILGSLQNARLLERDAHRAPIRVETYTRATAGLPAFARLFLEKHREQHQHLVHQRRTEQSSLHPATQARHRAEEPLPASVVLDLANTRAVFSVLAMVNAHGDPTCGVLWSTFVRTRRLRPRDRNRAFKNRPNGGLLRVFVRHGARFRYMVNSFVAGSLPRPGAREPQRSVDPVGPWLFFQDQLIEALHYFWYRARKPTRLSVVQQTFAAPFDTDVLALDASAEDRATEEQRITRMLELIRCEMLQQGSAGLACDPGGAETYPSMVDVIVLPRAEGYLSPSFDWPHGGFAVTVGLVGTSDRDYRTRAERALARIAARIRTDIHPLARVHLSKNVFVDPADLQAQYGAGVAALQAVRDRWDPRGVFSSDFWESQLRA